MDRSAAQLGLFGSLEGFPEGFSYEENILSLEEERTLVRAFAGLPLKAFEFQGFQGKRRVVSFGLHYDFNTRGLGSAEAIPEFMMAVREKAAGFAEVSAESLQHVLVTEYAPGAGIGWHSDRPEFGIIIGVSLVAPCHFRLRRKIAPTKWQRASLIAQPRSIYLMQGTARHEWQHSIPPVDSLRYSVTFRTLNKSKG
jgi:alkylated DNA repair dioxygenase AlkB